MSKQNFILKVSIFIALAIILSSSLLIKAQTPSIYIPPVELYRFRVSGNNLGYMLTPYYSEGVNSGFTFDGVVGSMYVPQFGYTPTTPGLNPIHRWRVVQDGRLYYYYATSYQSHGSDYTYEGIRGYMFDPSLNTVNPYNLGEIPLYKVKGCYSQSYGYWYGKLTPLNPPFYSLESPPAPTFDCSAYHGTIGGGPLTGRGTQPGASYQISDSQVSESLPSGDSYAGENIPVATFVGSPPPPPPPTCDTQEESFCYRNDGNWDPDTCSCIY